MSELYLVRFFTHLCRGLFACSVRYDRSMFKDLNLNLGKRTEKIGRAGNLSKDAFERATMFSSDAERIR